jgi:hypothetical protein
MHGSGSSLLLLFLKILNKGWARVVLGVVLAILHGIGCWVFEGRALLQKEKKCSLSSNDGAMQGKAKI